MADTLDLEDVPAAFVDAWNRHDMPALAGLFAEDANFVNAVGMWWRSQAEIEAAHATAHATVFKNSHLDGGAASLLKLRPGVAAVHMAWELTGQTGPNHKPSEPRRGILLLVLTEGRGGWRIRVAQNTDIA